MDKYAVESQTEKRNGVRALRWTLVDSVLIGVQKPNSSLMVRTSEVLQEME